jgi:hypothetical protein
MDGTLVEAVCYFVERQRASALGKCAQRRPNQDFHPALVTSDSILYLLAASASTPATMARLTPLLGRNVKVDGTVFPAANAYLIVLDSLRAEGP